MNIIKDNSIRSRRNKIEEEKDREILYSKNDDVSTTIEKVEGNYLPATKQTDENGNVNYLISVNSNFTGSFTIEGENVLTEKDINRLSSYASSLSSYTKVQIDTLSELIRRYENGEKELIGEINAYLLSMKKYVLSNDTVNPSTVKQLEDKIDELNKRIEELNLLNEELEEEKDNILYALQIHGKIESIGDPPTSAEKIAIEKEFDRLRGILNDRYIKIQNLLTIVEQRNREIETLKKQIPSEGWKSKEEFEKEEKNYLSVINSLREQINKLSEKVEYYETESTLSSLIQRVDYLTSYNESLGGLADRLQETVNQLNNELNNKEDYINIINKQLNDLQGTIDYSAYEDMSKEIERLKGIIKDSYSSSSLLEGELFRAINCAEYSYIDNVNNKSIAERICYDATNKRIVSLYKVERDIPAGTEGTLIQIPTYIKTRFGDKYLYSYYLYPSGEEYDYINGRYRGLISWDWTDIYYATDENEFVLGKEYDDYPPSSTEEEEEEPVNPPSPPSTDDDDNPPAPPTVPPFEIKTVREYFNNNVYTRNATIITDGWIDSSFPIELPNVVNLLHVPEYTSHEQFNSFETLHPLPIKRLIDEEKNWWIYSNGEKASWNWEDITNDYSSFYTWNGIVGTGSRIYK